MYSRIGGLVFVSQSVTGATGFSSCEGVLGSLSVFGRERVGLLAKRLRGSAPF